MVQERLEVPIQEKLSIVANKINNEREGMKLIVIRSEVVVAISEERTTE
jgi:hypothetical protein